MNNNVYIMYTWVKETSTKTKQMSLAQEATPVDE